MQRRSCGRGPATPHPVDERLGVHPLGPGPILHLGGSSPPKIKFLQHPFSFQSPQPPEPGKSTRCAIHPEEPHSRGCPSSEDSHALHWLSGPPPGHRADETHPQHTAGPPKLLTTGGCAIGHTGSCLVGTYLGCPPHACTPDGWGPALPILLSSSRGTLVGVAPSHCWIRTF
uniref:Uncharacterized protein pp8857 n=1 Tax=Homo sapiens TaxID=9606 RepID=Q8WYT5_HUMAN|nr:unknown [Homo sapiens]